MDMKKILIILFLSVNLMIVAQTERPITPVDWDYIRTEVEHNPQRVKALVERMALLRMDSTMTSQDRILAFFGQSYISCGEEMNVCRDMKDSLRCRNMEVVSELADSILKVNPLSLDALIGKLSYYLDLDNNHPDRSWSVEEDVKKTLLRIELILNTIAMTGDGSKIHPFAVTCVADEYNFIRYYLQISNIKGQAFLGDTDRISLGESNEFYKEKNVYFDITRCLELEQKGFRRK